MADRPRPALLWGVAGYPPGTSLGERRFAGHEWVWLESGCATLIAGGQRQAIDPECVVLLRGAEAHRIRFAGDLLVRQGYVRLPGPPPAGPWVRRLPATHLCRRLLPALPGLLDRADAAGRELAQRGLLLLRAAWLDAGAEPPAPALPPVLDQLAGWVAERWLGGAREPIPLAELARVAGVSPAQLDRLFRGACGLAPAAALRRIRLHQAALRLRYGAADQGGVAAAAAFAGFASPFAFSKAFRAVYGSGPRAWRRSGQAPAFAQPGLQALLDRMTRAR